MKYLFSVLCLASVFVSFASSIDVTTLENSGENTYVVSDLSSNNSYFCNSAQTVDLVFDLAEDVEYSGVISGNIRLVKKGAGTLLLKSENTYTGGTLIEKGILAVNNALSLSLGTVSIIAHKDGETPCRLRIDSAMTFANDIVISGGYSKSGNYAPGSAFDTRATLYINTASAITFSGDITSSCDIYIWDVSNNKKQNFTGKVSADGNHIIVAPYNSTYVFSGGVKAEVFCAIYRYLHMGNVRFQDAPIDIDKLLLNYTKLELGNVFDESVLIKQEGNAEAVRSYVSLIEDVTCGGWATSSIKSDNKNLSYAIKSNPTSTARTLTLKPNESHTSYGTLCDNVTLVYDPLSSDCVQTLTSLDPRNHTTQGAIVVKNGTFQITGLVSLSKLTAIRVADGAKFIADTKGATPFVGLQEITVGAGGEFYCAGNTVNPFSKGTVKLTVGEGASLTLPENEILTVTELYYNGKRMRGGEYTPDGDDGTIAFAELKSGRIFVPSFVSEAVVSHWNGSTSSDISVASNWDGGVLPDFMETGNELVFASKGSSSTSAIVSRSVEAKNITFCQPLGFTLLSTPDGVLNLYEGVVFGDIGEVAPNYTLDVPARIASDQTWTLPDNPSSVFTISKPLLSDPRDPLTTLYITNNVGELNFFSTNSTYQGNIVAQAKTMRVSGENVFGVANEGSKVTLRLNHHENTAKCYFMGCTIEKPLTCSMSSIGTNYSIFECAAGTTNIFKGKVDLPQWTSFGKDSYTVFENGVKIIGYNRQQLQKNAVIVFRGGEVNFHNDGGNHGMHPMSFDLSRMVFECKVGIEEKENVRITSTTIIDFRFEQAISTGKWMMEGTMLLNGFSQTAANLDKSWGTISSTNVPAFVSLNLAQGGNETNALKFVDMAGFKMVGPGFVRLNGISTTSGTLAVENGTVELGDATWLNTSNVVISSTGVLRLTKADVFDHHKAVITFADEGTIDVPSNVNQRFESGVVMVDGVAQKIAPGTYDSSSTGIMQGRVTGEGKITVVAKALVIQIR